MKITQCLFGYADTETQASTRINSFTSSVTNGVNTVTQQEYYEYDTVGNITYLEGDTYIWTAGMT